MYSLPAGCDEPALTSLLNYWQSRSRGGLLPGRRDIDPLDFPPALLPQLLLFDVVRAPDRLRFRFRVAGTAFGKLIGRDVTGQIFDEIAPPDRTDPVNAALTAIAESGRPGYLAGRLTLRSDTFEQVRRLGVPLAADGRRVDMVLGMWVAEPRPAADLPAMLRERPPGQVHLLEPAAPAPLTA